MIPRLWILGAAGWAAAGMLTWLWIGALQDLAAEREGCNSDKLRSSLEAERIARETLEQASQARVAQLEEALRKERQALEMAEQARTIAESRTAEVREVIREVAVNDPDSCLNTAVPDIILDSLRP